MNTFPQKLETTPLARVIPIGELSGGLDKTLEVPPGRMGIVLGPDGTARTFSPGRQRVFTLGERLRGRSGEARVGYYTPGPFNAVIEAPYLLSGDDVLLDASLFAAVQVADPARYFIEQVVPISEARAAEVNLSGPAAQAALSAVARCYAASDLTQGLPTRRLVEEIRPGLAAALQNLGLRLESIQVLTFWRSDERVRIAERVQEIDERLQQLAAEKQMAEQERRAAAADFTQQLQAELGTEFGVRVAEDTAPTAPAHTDSLSGVRGWVAARKDPQPKKARWNLRELFRRESGEAGQERARKQVRRPPRRWWLPSALWILFLLAGGYVSTRLFMRLEGRVSPEILYGTVFSVWLIVLPLVFDALRKLVEKREAIAEATWMLPSATRLDALVGRDRAKADGLVRAQCAAELNRAKALLDDLVTRAYKAGDSAGSLRLRDTRLALEAAASTVTGPTFGTPAYLSEIRLSGTAWDRMLDYDEDLLLYANALAEKTLHFQQQWISGVQESAGLVELERHLADLLYRFEGRANALRSTQQ